MNIEEVAKTGTVDDLRLVLDMSLTIAPGPLANALAEVVFRQEVESVKLLLQRGANPNVLPTQSMPPMHCAVEQQNRTLVEILLAHGGDINWADENGFTPLHLGVDVEADSAWQRGETPDGSFVEFLLERGANPSSRSSSGDTPLKTAEQYEFERAIELLQDQRFKKEA